MTVAEFVVNLETDAESLRVLVSNNGGTEGSSIAFEKLLESNTESAQKTIELGATLPFVKTHMVP